MVFQKKCQKKSLKQTLQLALIGFKKRVTRSSSLLKACSITVVLGLRTKAITKLNIDDLRSGFEANFYKDCLAVKRKHRFEIEYEPEQFNYFVEHWYKPDWLIRKRDDSAFFVETKGYWTSQDRSKIKKVLEQHSGLDLRMVFQYDNKLHKSSNTRYSDWCSKHNIPFAIGKIPEEWFE